MSCMATIVGRPLLGRFVQVANIKCRSESGWIRAQTIFPQRLALPESHGYVPVLSPPQVTSIISIHEVSVSTKTVGRTAAKYFDSNHLASNNPIEDRRAVGQLVQTGGLLFSVYDGHGGAACAQSISERLFDYIAVSLLSQSELEQYNHAIRTDTPMDLVKKYPFKYDYISDEMTHLFRTSLHRYVDETLSCLDLDDTRTTDAVSVALRDAFIRLDNDISTEGLPKSGVIDLDCLEIGLSGSCACVAHISDKDVSVANLGDTRAVLGQLDDDGKLVAVPLSSDHNTDNEGEKERVIAAHPSSETQFLFKANRLLGSLIPLRAFGDMRFKWSIKDLKNIANILDSVYSQNLVLKNYYTPPYLINEPETIHHKLSKKDKFMILATDGLWETMSNEKVVNLVGEHLEGKQTADRFELADKQVRKLGHLNEELVKRKSGLAHKALDENCATHLIRHALGYKHSEVSEMLTFPPQIARHYRDDITVTVVYFDEDLLAD